MARSPEWNDLGKRPREVREVVEGLMRGGKLARMKRQGGLARVWGDVVSPEIAAHTRAERFHRGTLTVVCSSSAMLSELANFHKEELLMKLRDACKTRRIERLEFKLGKVAGKR